MTRRSGVLLAALGVVVSLACGQGDNSLTGSLSEVFDLDVSTVHVIRNDEALVVSYEHNAGRDIDLVLRFTLALDQLPMQTGKSVKLDGFTDGGTLRATFLHNAAGEPARVLPDVSIGEFTLDKGGDPGDDTSGSFSASFVSDGTYGSGRAVSGRFHATALDGGYGDWIP
ncbi:MAG TPA: hypothetical protein VFI53_05995 [Myxococcaceae bacterium]|nr:hypothetical protein [Myxococcaceae bacterium]